MAQFVPLKIDTDGANWGEWARKYRHEGNAIPILYVVRADGQQMYGQSGSKQGGELPQFLTAQLVNAGTIFSNPQLALIHAAVEDAKKAIAEADAWTAVKRMESLRRLGDLGRFGSYATAALEADLLYGKLVEEGKVALTRAREQLAGNDKFSGVLGIVTANRVYAKLPELRKELGSAERELGKQTEFKELLRQAQPLDKALAQLSQKNGKKVAVPMLQGVITKFPDSPAAELAMSKLTALGVPPAP